MRRLLAFALLAGACLSTPLLAQKKNALPEGRPPVFEALINCRAIAGAEERLACYDTKVAAIDAAEKNKELVLADRESMKEARRGLFGFSLPKLKLFGNGDGDDAEEEAELVTKVDSAYQKSPGKWTIVLDGGARWTQIDTQSLPRNPAKGMEVKIRKASMGSYFANVDGQRAIRMMRVN